MAIELVTGKKGTVHVDSADDGALYAAIAGKGEYVLDLDDRLACTMTTANKAHVASGHGLMQGRHWLIDAEGVDLTIQNGTQGQKRNDLIVARYECDAKNGNIESVALKVIKGTPTTGTPADPACTRGDILEGAALVNEQPLWRIPLNGITVGTPIQMFDVLTPAKEAWDSVAHASGVITPVFNLETSWQLTRRAGWAYLDLRAYTLQSAFETWNTPIARLPEGFRPAKNIRSMCMIEAQYWEQVAPGYVTIFPNGDVELDYRVNFAPYTCDVSAVFPLA